MTHDIPTCLCPTCHQTRENLVRRAIFDAREGRDLVAPVLSCGQAEGSVRSAALGATLDPLLRGARLDSEYTASPVERKEQTVKDNIIGPVWITKHALTAPILRLEQVGIREGGAMISWYGAGSNYMEHAHGEGREWHRTEEGAHARVRVMAEAKIKSLDKQRAKMLQRLDSGARVTAVSGRPA